MYFVAEKTGNTPAGSHLKFIFNGILLNKPCLTGLKKEKGRRASAIIGSS